MSGNGYLNSEFAFTVDCWLSSRLALNRSISLVQAFIHSSVARDRLRIDSTKSLCGVGLLYCVAQLIYA